MARWIPLLEANGTMAAEATAAKTNGERRENMAAVVSSEVPDQDEGH